MNAINLDQKINSFLNRKDVEFPELSLTGRESGSRTAKHDISQTSVSQILFCR